MTTEIVFPIESEQWYTQLVEECKDIITETSFTSRWTLVEGYHQVGVRILQDNDNFERSRIYGQEIMQRIANSLGKRSRTIYYVVQFARMFPDLNLLKEGKNISWSHIINKYLTDGKGKPAKVTPVEMLKQIKQLLQTEWLKANQLQIGGSDSFERNRYEDKCEFIRYLQDQVEKITGGTNELVF